jgi:hypothetical protein
MSIQLERKMDNRTAIQAADLYVLLQRELRRRQSPTCQTCFIQLPFRVDRRDPKSPNWEVVISPPCPLGCRGIIEDLVNELGARYDLKPAGSESRSA